MNIGLDQEQTKTKKCNHGFEIKDLCDLTKDPKCKRCGETLTKLSKDKNKT